MQKHFRLTTESFQVNLKYKESIYQIRFIDQLDEMILANIYFEYSDLSVQIWAEQKKNFHIFLFTSASVQFITHNYTAFIYGFHVNKTTTYLVNHKKIPGRHIHHDNNTLVIFSNPDFMLQYYQKSLKTDYLTNKFENFLFKIYFITFLNNKIFYFRMKYMRKRLKLQEA